MSLAYGIIVFISLCMVGVCVAADKKRDIWMLLVFVSVSICNLGYFMISVSPNLGSALNSNRLSYLGSVFLPFFILMMVLRFCGMKCPKPLMIALVTIGIVMLGITTSPGILPIYYSSVDIEIADGATKLVREYGPLHSLYYVQYIATDVSDLHRNRVELQEENAQLRKVQSDLQLLSANVVAATREEETLNTKMRVHDEMGRCLVEVRKYLREDCSDSIPDNVVTSWLRAVSMLKYNNEATDGDMLLQIRKTCKSLKLDFVQMGELPKSENAAYILTCAVRECLTNAVRYAVASRLYADFRQTDTTASVTVTNNGVRRKVRL